MGLEDAFDEGSRTRRKKMKNLFRSIQAQFISSRLFDDDALNRSERDKEKQSLYIIAKKRKRVML